jgi:hypothetical protein
MHFPIRTITLITLTLSSYSTAGPIVQKREVQERATSDVLPLVASLGSLGSAITTAQNAVTGLSTPSGVTVASIGVRTSRLLICVPTARELTPK